MIAFLPMQPMADKDAKDNLLELTILSRENCHLCDVVHRILLSLQAEFALKIQKASIDGDATQLKRYGMRVPVVLIDGIERCAGKTTEGELRRAIKRARWRRPISRILSRLGYAPRRG
jgi:glutaredoxin